jgi:hypothetical protein
VSGTPFRKNIAKWEPGQVVGRGSAWANQDICPPYELHNLVPILRTSRKMGSHSLPSPTFTTSSISEW